MTLVDAPIERCFQLSLSVELLALAAQEQPVAGVTHGLLGPGQTVTWQRTSFGFKRKRQILIETWRPTVYFRETLLSGPFRNFTCDHHFAPMNDGTRIRDEIQFTAPWGPLGHFSENIARRRLTRYLEQRNQLIKRIAESDEWHRYLDGQPAIDTRPYQATGTTSDIKQREYAG